MIKTFLKKKLPNLADGKDDIGDKGVDYAGLDVHVEDVLDE